MKEKKEKAAGKTAGTIKVADAVSAYNLLNQQKREGDKVKGVKLSALETADIFKVLYVVKALKPIANAYTDFRKDVAKQFEPENWQERVGRCKDASDEEEAGLDKEYAEWQEKISECLSKELESEKAIEAYERLDKDAFGLLVKENGDVLDVPQIVAIMEVLV